MAVCFLKAVVLNFSLKSSLMKIITRSRVVLSRKSSGEGTGDPNIRNAYPSSVGYLEAGTVWKLCLLFQHQSLKCPYTFSTAYHPDMIPVSKA